MFLKIVKYLLPIFCFSVLSAEFDLNTLNEELSSSVVTSLNILGAKGVDQIINLKIGDENKIEILEYQDIVLTDKNIFLYNDEFGEINDMQYEEQACCKLNFRVYSLGSIGGYIKYNITLKELPEYITVKNRGFLTIENLNSSSLNIVVKNCSKVTLSGKVDEQFVEIDYTSSYCAEKLETKNTEVIFKNLNSVYDLPNKCVSDYINYVVIDASNSLKVFGFCWDVPVFYKRSPLYLEYQGFYSRVERLSNRIR